MGSSDPSREPADNQQTGGQRDQPPQQTTPGYGAPENGPNSGGLLSDAVVKQYLTALVGTFVVLSLAIFVMILLLGSIGGPSMTVDQELSSAQESQLQDAYKAALVQSAVGMSPYLGFAVVAVFGLIIGSQLSRPQSEKLKISALCAFAGLSVFVFLTIFLSSTQMPDLSNLAGAGGGGVATGTSLDFGQLLINSIVFGIVGSIIASGGTYFSDRMTQPEYTHRQSY